VTRLDARALNRATLARQLLLARDHRTALDAVAHLGGLQAQEPHEPYVGLWSRLAGFAPAALADLLVDRRVVRTHLMRHTVHLLTASDALAWRALHEPMLRQRMQGVLGRAVGGVDTGELAGLVERLVAVEPRILPDAVREVGDRWPGVAVRDLVSLLPSVLPLVQVPPRALWGQTAPARVTTFAAWLGRPPHDPTPEALDALVLRYLAAFGPAATADVRAWSGLAGLPAAVDRVRDRLVTFRDARNRELLDLPDAPRPDPDTPAPVRFLPAFDNVVLGYDDRSRMIDREHRGLSVTGARFVLVDGRVAGTWTATGGSVTVTPLVRFIRADRTAVGEEARALAEFLGDGARPKVTVGASPR
jgi:hypothetical protein